MSTPEGWSLANYWYDHKPTRIVHRLAYESLHRMVLFRRQQGELLSTRALVQSILGQKEGQKEAVEAFQAYYDMMVPYMEDVREKERAETHKKLEEFVSQGPVKIDVSKVYQDRFAKVMAKTSALTRKYESGQHRPTDINRHGSAKNTRSER